MHFRRKCTREFKLTAVRRLEAGQSVGDVVRALEVHPSTLRDWRAQLCAHLYADIIQVAGSIPHNVKALHLDFATRSNYKWHPWRAQCLCPHLPGSSQQYAGHRPSYWRPLREVACPAVSTK